MHYEWGVAGRVWFELFQSKPINRKINSQERVFQNAMEPDPKTRNVNRKNTTHAYDKCENVNLIRFVGPI